MPKFDDRFARQNRCEPPPEFPLASPYPSIVHHLSGPGLGAPTQIRPRTSGPVGGAPEGSPPRSLSFRAGVFHARTLAPSLDSLVRVSRRVACGHYASALAPRGAVLGPRGRSPAGAVTLPRGAATFPGPLSPRRGPALARAR